MNIKIVFYHPVLHEIIQKIICSLRYEDNINDLLMQSQDFILKMNEIFSDDVLKSFEKEMGEELAPHNRFLKAFTLVYQKNMNDPLRFFEKKMKTRDFDTAYNYFFGNSKLKTLNINLDTEFGKYLELKIQIYADVFKMKGEYGTKFVGYVINEQNEISRFSIKKMKIMETFTSRIKKVYREKNAKAKSMNALMLMKTNPTDNPSKYSSKFAGFRFHDQIEYLYIE